MDEKLGQFLLKLSKIGRVLCKYTFDVFHFLPLPLFALDYGDVIYGRPFSWSFGRSSSRGLFESQPWFQEKKKRYGK